ncbi:MAG: hypothetical protein IJD43_11535 [Thermoguttaceae bacterium]|nr:hypothetical protein [Thermoguttaceae bacterium]
MEFGAGYTLGFYVANGRRVYYYYPEPADISITIDAVPSDTVPVDVPADDSECFTDVPEVLEEITEEVPQPELLQKDGTLTEAPAMDIPLESVAEVPNSPDGTEEKSILEGPEIALPKISRSEVDAAWQEILTGDSAFANGELADAVAKYAGVSETLPSMPDPWFRLAYAETARGNYEQASEYCLKGLRASRLWPVSPFSLDYVYQANTERKNAVLASLENAARNQPEDENLNLLTGFAFYADGQNAKAAEFLKKAEKISPDLAEFTEPVLKNIP